MNTQDTVTPASAQRRLPTSPMKDVATKELLPKMAVLNPGSTQAY
jgi:hypothetical protein